MDERKYMATLLDNIPELQIVRRLVRQFKTMLWRGMGNIERWIDFIKKSKYKLVEYYIICQRTLNGSKGC